MAPSSEYRKRSHSRSEILGFPCALKNAGSVYCRRYSVLYELLYEQLRLLENDSGSFSSSPKSRVESREVPAWAGLLFADLHIAHLLLPNREGPHSVRLFAVSDVHNK